MKPNLRSAPSRRTEKRSNANSTSASFLSHFAMGRPRFRHIVLFGAPGVGKGAQAQILSHRYGLVHISTGELIREEIKDGTDLGRRVQEAVERGEFADDDTVVGIVVQRLDLPEYQKGFVLDGFPRTIRQAELLDQLLAERGKSIDCALFFEAPEEVILERLAGRRICSKCGTTYHKEFKRPRIHGICDVCQGEVTRRHDDTPGVHRARLKTYHEKTAPLKAYYAGTGVLVEIDADQSIQGVAGSIAAIIDQPVGKES